MAEGLPLAQAPAGTDYAVTYRPDLRVPTRLTSPAGNSGFPWYAIQRPASQQMDRPSPARSRSTNSVVGSRRLSLVRLA